VIPLSSPLRPGGLAPLLLARSRRRHSFSRWKERVGREPFPFFLPPLFSLRCPRSLTFSPRTRVIASSPRYYEGRWSPFRPSPSPFRSTGFFSFPLLRCLDRDRRSPPPLDVGLKIAALPPLFPRECAPERFSLPSLRPGRVRSRAPSFESRRDDRGSFSFFLFSFL